MNTDALDLSPDFLVAMCASGLISHGHPVEAVAEAGAKVALQAMTELHGSGYAGDWLAGMGTAAARGSAASAAENAVRAFDETNLSLEAKQRIIAVLAEVADANSQPKLVADALMGAALSYITDTSGLYAKMVYLRGIADQIEEALARGGAREC